MTILLFFTMARSTMATLYSFEIIKWFVPMGFNIQIHSFIGFATVMHSLGHTAGHIVYHTYFVEGGFGHSFVQASLLRGEAWRTKGSGDAITGFLLLGSLLLMAWTALTRGNSSLAYKGFSIVHLLYNTWLIFIFFHVPHLWPWFMSIGALMICERAYDFLRRTTHSTLAYSRPCKNGVTFLSIPRASAPSYPGAYYRIKVPELSVFEWHPFSLASSVSSHHLTFFVASTGDWTRGLHELVSDLNRRNNASIQVE
jgi:predicted ferric reductase